MSAQVPHNHWVVNRRFTSRCDFCDQKNIVLQRCEAPGCHINICKPCLATGVLEDEEKHKLGGEHAGCFDWRRRVTAHQEGSMGHVHTAAATAATPPTEETAVMVCLPNTPVKVEASRRGESSTSHIAAAAAALHTPDSASHRCGRRRTDISLQECSVLSSVPACSASMPLRSASHPDHVSVPVSRTYHTPGTPLEDEPRRNASSHRGGEHPKAPEGTHKTSPKHARKGAKRQAATRKAFASKVPKKKRRIDVSDRAEGDVLEAAQILVTISHVGHAAHPQATPHVVHPATPPESVKTPVPSRRPAASLPTPSSSAPGSAPKFKRKHTVQSLNPFLEADVPWNPMQDCVPLTSLKWNEREKRGPGLTARALNLRKAWKTIMDHVIHQFGIEEDEEIPLIVDQLNLAWHRMQSCILDMSAENQLNRAIGVAVRVEVERLLQEALSKWSDGS